MRRLFKETYRLNKTKLIENSINSRIFLNILFAPAWKAYNDYKSLRFSDLDNDMKFLLQKISSDFKIE